MKTVNVLLLLLVLVSGCSKGSAEVPPPPTTTPPVQTRQNLTFNLEGEDFDFPLDLQVFLDRKWRSDQSLDHMIEPNQYIEGVFLRRVNDYLIVSVFNDTDEPIALRDGLVVRLKLDHDYTRYGIKQNPLDFTINDAITWFITRDEFATLFKTEAVENHNKVYENYSFELESHQFIHFSFYLEEPHALRYIEMEDFIRK